ncbi:MAG: hypothetical protein SFV53_01900 [Rickettsiales bacterium]|nr:hypothetical protein [Rickettsiales bacterium]
MKFFTFFLSALLTFSAASYAASNQQFPNISGQTLFQLKSDRIISTNEKGIPANNSFSNIESNFSLNLNKNWSTKTLWKLSPSSVYTTRDPINPERTRTFLSSNRTVNPVETSLIIEELKAQYEDEDMKVFFGKFDPSFGVAYKNNNRIGVFSADVTKDYELREKIGGGITALLEDAEISFNTFFNDTTGLSGSINGRKNENRNSGLAGNTGTLSSYTVSMQGQKLFGYENWFYNLGYRSLGVNQGDSTTQRARETGYVLGSQYQHKIGFATSVIPFFEMSKINDFTGEKGRNATYATFALIGKYSGWSASISEIIRRINQAQRGYNIRDHQTQISLGYKFKNNLSIDVSRAEMKESNHSAVLFGVIVGYVYNY